MKLSKVKLKHMRRYSDDNQATRMRSQHQPMRRRHKVITRRKPSSVNAVLSTFHEAIVGGEALHEGPASYLVVPAVQVTERQSRCKKYLSDGLALFLYSTSLLYTYYPACSRFCKPYMTVCPTMHALRRSESGRLNGDSMRMTICMTSIKP